MEIKQPKLVCAGHIVVDDIIFHTGRTCFGQLGGNALYSATGAWFWRSEHVGIVSRRGSNLPAEQIEVYRRKGIDVSGVYEESHILSPQSWQIYDQFNNRFTVFNPHAGDRNVMSPDVACFPTYCDDIEGLHIAPLMPLSLVYEIAQKYYGSCTVICDPSPIWFLPENREQVSALLKKIDVFLPSEIELMKFYGLTKQLPLYEYLPYLEDCAQLGAEKIVLKVGSQGVIVYDAGHGDFFRLPALPMKPINTTGAGDAFCGGFLSDYAQSRDLFSAAVCGTISSSFVVERNLIVDCLAVVPDMVRARSDEFASVLHKENLN